MRVEGKVAVIAGGGFGIGRATAEQIAREGAKDESSFVTWATLAVDGGQTAQV